METTDYSSLLRGFTEVEGDCPTHGRIKVHLHARIGRKEWYCPECSMAEQRKADEAKWLADRNETLHRIAHIPLRYRGERFTATTERQKIVRTQVKAFADLIAAGQKWAVLVLFGGVGTGKTLIASELAQSLIDKHSMSVRYCTAKQMIAEIQASYGAEGKSEEGEVLRFVQYGLLILDEIDAKPDKDNANILLTEVINRRYNEEKPVVVITNQSFDTLGKFIGDRVADRLHENAFVCAFDWGSFRRSK